MKKTFIISFMMAATAVMVLSCGGAGKVQNAPAAQQTNPYGTEIALTECEQYALAAPGKRAYGKGNSYNENTARELAELNARTAMSRAIDAAVISAMKSGSLSYEQYAGDDESGMAMRDEATKTNNLGKLVSSNIIRNTNIVKVNKFYGKNRQYTVFVCLEYNGTVADMAKQVVKDVRQNVSDADRAKIDRNLKEFEEEVERGMMKPQK